jgi:hypothetical protein
MVKLYTLDHPYIKETYPVVHKVFTEETGYERFKQIGLFLKQKQKDRH